MTTTSSTMKQENGTVPTNLENILHSEIEIKDEFWHENCILQPPDNTIGADVALCSQRLSSSQELRMPLISASLQKPPGFLQKPHPKPTRKRSSHRKIYPCKHCDFKAVWRSTLHEHVAKVHQGKTFACNHCGRIFYMNSRLRRHLKTHQVPDRSEIHFCPKCDFTAHSHSLLRSHVVAKHGVPKFECDYCQKMFPLKAILRQHITEKHITDPQMCILCGTWFKNCTTLSKHNWRRHTTKSLVCDFPGCTKSYMQLAALETHKAKHINKNLSSKQKPSSFLQCEYCQVGFTEESSLNKHMSSKHAKEIDRKLGGYQCNYCKTVLPKKLDLIQHINIKHSQNVTIYSCPHCDYTMNYQHGITLHIARKHRGYSFKCDRCNKQFAVKSDFTRHVNNSHGLATLVCTICGQQCGNRTSLKLHHAKKHIDKPFEDKRQIRRRRTLIESHKAKSTASKTNVKPLISTPKSSQRKREPRNLLIDSAKMNPVVLLTRITLPLDNNKESKCLNLKNSPPPSLGDFEFCSVVAEEEIHQESPALGDLGATPPFPNDCGFLTRFIEGEIRAEGPVKICTAPDDLEAALKTTVTPFVVKQENVEVPPAVLAVKPEVTEVPVASFEVEQEDTEASVISPEVKQSTIQIPSVIEQMDRAFIVAQQGYPSNVKIKEEFWVDDDPPELAENGVEEAQEEPSQVDTWPLPSFSYQRSTFPLQQNKTPKELDRSQFVKCDFCKRIMISREALDQHISEKHSKYYAWKVKSLSNGYLGCSYCDFKSFSSSTLFSHVQRTHLSPKFECYLCRKQFRTKIDLQMHIHRGHHSLDKSRILSCSKCTFTTARFVSLQTHIRQKHQNPKFECDYCKKKFTRKYNLAMHIDAVHSGYPRRCDICGSWFQNRWTYDVHRRTQHPLRDSRKNSPTEQNIQKPKNILCCSKCTFTTNNPGSLGAHIMWRHESPRFECDYCKKKFVQKYTLKVHVETHMNCPEPCEICGVWFKAHSSRHKHWQTVHKQQNHSQKSTTERSTRKAKSVLCCSECPYTTNRIASLRAHTRREHEGPRFECEHCQKKFMTNGSLKTHQITHIRSLKPCKVCGLWFKNRHLRNEHWRAKHKRGTSKKTGVDVILLGL